MKTTALLLALLALPLTSRGQMWDTMCVEPLGVDSAQTGVLGVRVTAMAFFRDNEYDGSPLTQGYTLPGVWLKPVLTYNPLDQLHLELGAYAIFYDGANKYPTFAYHDIATWKGNQYRRGAHALPFFRAEARLRSLSLVLGNLYGAQNHRLIEPMMNPELNLSADPEMGFQLIFDRRYVHFDAWIDWQSYIYKLDTHQEAFTVGGNATIVWNPEGKRLRWTTPVQLLIQHRGGEQDTTALGVQTLANASVGVRLDCPTPRPVISNLSAEVNLLGSYQQSGHLLPFDTGFATYAAVGITLWQQLCLRAGYFASPKQYANLYGNPFFSTLSVKEEGLTYRGMHTTYLRADYAHSFGPSYCLGAEVEAISAHSHSLSDTHFSFGVYLRVSPQFTLKRFKQ